MDHTSQNGSQSGAKAPGASAGQHRWRTWQSDDDIPQRKIMIQHMYVARDGEERGECVVILKG